MKQSLNVHATHPLQTTEWGEFREKTGVKVVRFGNFSRGAGSRFAGQLTIHKIPHLPFTIGYLPKGSMPTKKLVAELTEIGKKEKCIFIQLEPNVVQIVNLKSSILNLGLRPAAHPLFTRYTFQLDLTKSEEELLKNMHSKTRYNIRVAEKHGVTVKEETGDEAFEVYLKLTHETTQRQQFYAHDERYHVLMWEVLRATQDKPSQDGLTAHLLLARYKGKPLVAWVLFVFKDTLYYPYGASSGEHREVMASNLMMWEAIKFGKKLGLKTFDMWGALGPTPDTKDPWFGFHRFKEGYGPKHVEFIGSYDLVIKPFLYQLYVIADKLRWIILKMKR